MGVDLKTGYAMGGGCVHSEQWSVESGYLMLDVD